MCLGNNIFICQVWGYQSSRLVYSDWRFESVGFNSYGHEGYCDPWKNWCLTTRSNIVEDLNFPYRLWSWKTIGHLRGPDVSVVSAGVLRFIAVFTGFRRFILVFTGTWCFVVVFTRARYLIALFTGDRRLIVFTVARFLNRPLETGPSLHPHTLSRTILKLACLPSFLPSFVRLLKAFQPEFYTHSSYFTCALHVPPTTAARFWSVW